jgi:hypothetical protein
MIGDITKDKELMTFIKGKSVLTLELFQHFVDEYNKVGNVVLYPTKTMIGIANKDNRIAWITQLGKNFVHIVFPFQKAIIIFECIIKKMLTKRC